jgi:ABC-type uncharacterized transport system substrate-binding protein
MVDRRALLAYTAACALILSSRANSQPPAKLPRVALVYNSIPLAALAHHPIDRAFVAGLRDLGLVEGQNIILGRRSADGHYDRLPLLMQELLSLPVDVIVAIGPAVGAARRATDTVPIVAVATDGLVESGAAKSLGRPGRNVTGLTGDVGMDMNNKRLQLLKEVAPNASRVAFLGLVRETTEPSRRPAIEPAARALGQKIIWVGADAPADFERAFAEIAEERADALFVDTTPVNYVHIGSITAFAATRRMPALYAFREGPEAGGLMSFGSNIADLYRRAAGYVAKILRGAKPGDLPIEQPTKVELVINMKAASALGLTIPQSLLLRADEVMR